MKLEEGLAKTGGTEKPEISLCRHLASCGWQSLNKDELMGPFSSGTSILKKGGKEALLRVDSLGAGSLSGLHKCQAGWEGVQCHQLEKAGEKGKRPTVGPNLPSSSPTAGLPSLTWLGLSFPR